MDGTCSAEYDTVYSMKRISAICAQFLSKPQMLLQHLQHKWLTPSPGVRVSSPILQGPCASSMLLTDVDDSSLLVGPCGHPVVFPALWSWANLPVYAGEQLWHTAQVFPAPRAPQASHLPTLTAPLTLLFWNFLKGIM